MSRNRTVGLRIGKGEKLEDIIKSTNTVAEGVLTSRYCVLCFFQFLCMQSCYE